MKMLRHENVSEEVEPEGVAHLVERAHEKVTKGFGIEESRAVVGAGGDEVKVVLPVMANQAWHGLILSPVSQTRQTAPRLRHPSVVANQAWHGLILSPVPQTRQTAPRLRHPLYEQDARATSLHPVVVRTAATLGAHPGDDLVRIGDVAGLAVDAVRRVDLQVLAFTARIIFHLVDRRRTEVLAGIAVLARAAAVADIEVGDAQVARLVFFVMGRGVVDVGELIESQAAVGLYALVRRIGELSEVLHALVAGTRAVARADAASAGQELERAVHRARPESVLESLMVVAHLPQLVFHPA